MTPPDENEKSLVHDTWIRTMEELRKTHAPHTLVNGLAAICEGILRSAGHTPELRKFLDEEALKIMEKNG